MLYHQFILALRNLRRNGRYLIINVLGLGIALGFCILGWLNYRFANTFDHWHHEAERVVRVKMIKASNNDQYGFCPAALGPKVAADVPGVAAACRYDSRMTVVKRGDEVFNEWLTFADDNFFQFFDFESVTGQPNLSDRSKVYIDEATALKYFGKENPVGQNLLFYADTDKRLNLTVGGVLKNMPLNSSLRFELITHLDNQLDGNKKPDYHSWKYMTDALFLRMKPGTNSADLNAALQAYVAPHNAARPDWTVQSFQVEALQDWAHNSRFTRSNGLWPGVPPAAVWGNMTMAILLLMTAALNFANMTISICNRRLREIGVRKVMGGTRAQLVRQLLSEAFVVVTMATLVGMVLAFPIIEWFNNTWKFTSLKVDYSNPGLQLFLFAIVGLTTLLAGSYPAFYISSFKPSSIFRGGVLFGGSNYFSRVMMGLQVAISMVSVVVGLSFARNAEFNRTADIGFDYQPILQAWLPQGGDYQRFENAVKEIPGVLATAPSLHLPGFGYNMFYFQYKDEQQESILYQVGNNFAPVMKMRLVSGEWPAPAGDSSVSREIVVNETFIRKVGGGKPMIGEQIDVKGVTCRISGVVADFLTDTPFNPILSAVLQQIPTDSCRRCIIQTADVAQQPRIMSAIEEQWKQMFPYSPFNVGYQNEMMRDAIEASDNIARSMVGFAGVAILLCITGLFSLVSLNVMRRMREVAIRRVMGASSGHISWVLNKNYAWIFAAALLAGCLGGRFLALKLMDSIFKFNIGVQPQALLYSALGIIGMAALTIGFKIWQTLRVNPADVLRGE